MQKRSPNFEFESSFGSGIVMGVDEVGYGAWSGPVVIGAAALCLPLLPSELIESINDSKSLSLKRRETIYEDLLRHAGSGVYFSIAQASVQEIDHLNIRGATHLAIQRGVQDLLKSYQNLPWQGILMDGTHAPNLPLKTKCIVDGDKKSLSIAAASILAKVTRDRLMKNLAQNFPGFGWETNVGYGTKGHQEGLKTLGATLHHRMSYKPLKNLIKSV